MRIYERYDWGRLARFHVLDDRQYRTYQACQKPGRGDSNSVKNSCIERLAQSRSLLGPEQEAWLADGFTQSAAKWNILAQQTLMAQARQIPVNKAGDGQFWNDGWNGYPAARHRLFTDIAKHRPANPVVLSGDVHTFYATDLKRNFDRTVSPDNPILAAGFCSASITSHSQSQARTDRYVVQNPHIKYGYSDRRGFVMMEVTPARTMAHFQGLDNVQQADSRLSTLASFVVVDGKPGVMRTN